MGTKRNRWDSDSDDETTLQRKQRRSKKTQDSKPNDNDQCTSSHTSNDAEEVRESEENLGCGRKMVHNFYIHGCRSVDNYTRIGKIDEGTYGVVSKARCKVTGDIVALKQVKMSENLCQEGFPITALRETNVLLDLDHPNIISVREMVVGSTPDKIFMVMDYAENDLKAVMETKMKQPFLQSEVKYLLQSLLHAVAYMHERWYIHRDLKTSNLLYDSTGTLKVCDFGLARKYGSPIRSYTQLVVTLWYRSPELLLGATEYSTAVDMWSVGCIFGEMLLRTPLFPGRGEIEQLDQIFKVLGSPTEETWPGFDQLPGTNSVRWKWSTTNRLRDKFTVGAATFSGETCSLSNAGYDLLSKLLALDPKQRISAKDALKHVYFREAPLPKTQAMMPTFPSSS